MSASFRAKMTKSLLRPLAGVERSEKICVLSMNIWFYESSHTIPVQGRIQRVLLGPGGRIMASAGAQAYMGSVGGSMGVSGVQGKIKPLVRGTNSVP